MLRTLPRVHAGVFTFGAQNLEEDEFSPTSSMYMEPVLILAVPGATLFLFFLLSCCCFCYRRYRLGLCGEPIPTVTAYTPKEVCLSRTVALLSFAALLAAAFAAIVVSNASYSAGFQDIVASGYQTERIVNDSFKVGEELLQDSLAVSVELDDFNVHVAAQVDVQLLQLNLVCSRTLLSELPNGEIMRQGTADLGIAANAVPDASLTEGLFTALRRPQQQYPLLVPPLTTGLTSLQARVAALPDLPLLSAQLDQLNASVMNTTGVPVQINNALGALDVSLANLPNLTLLGDRLGRVSHLQTGDNYHLCSNIPVGWQPGDITDCDRLRAQLTQARDALDGTDVATPLALFESYDALDAEFPSLPTIVAALDTVRIELAACPDLPRMATDYAALEATIAAWDPVGIESSISMVSNAAVALQDANATRIVPELQALAAALTPLTCVRNVLTTLLAVNQSLLELIPSAELFYQRATALDAAMRSIPSPLQFIDDLDNLRTKLKGLPDLSGYTVGVSGISTALGAMPASAPLLTALASLRTKLELSPYHGDTVNVSTFLADAMTTLPNRLPFRTSLQGINASRFELPPLIQEALVAIEAYDNMGDTSGLAIVDTTLAAVQALEREMEARPNERLLRNGLRAIELELQRMPPTGPTVAQIEALDGSLQQLPNLGSYLQGLNGLLVAIYATPSVDTIDQAWSLLEMSLAAVPSVAETAGPLAAYTAVQALLPSPPTALLDGTFTLHALLASVPTLVLDGKRALLETHASTRDSVDTLLLALFGEAGSGYTMQLEAMRPTIEASWWIFLSATFALPAAISFVSVLSCAARFGRPALYAGHALMVVLPFYTLIGGSIELPLAIMLQDACEQVPLLSRQLTTYLSDQEMPQFDLLADPLHGWVTGCPQVDPMATFFTPIVLAAENATTRATEGLGALTLRASAREKVTRLSFQAAEIGRTADFVHGMLACRHFHALYERAHTAICCDVAYAFTAQWSVRLVTAWVMLASLIASVAGYKRFRRTKDLWGPYASVQALEVGSYL